ncbi:hypothetical protein [uncultured Maribacter sp.]|uniref:hypothetical protein n=1 Tax=uncultured Maribacter sp. TaxID=431308 RepID=UPI00262D430B|nr:hypothetical protein [uncultured Maribacter sp.]
MYVNGEDFVGYYENELVYYSKLAKITQDNQLIVFLDDDSQKVIKAQFEFNSNGDSVKIKSKLKNLYGDFKVNITEDKGALLMKLESDNGKIHLKRINAQINLQ